MGEPRDRPVRHVVAVGSGKGGVGKSTVTLNLALALKETGASVGILDADVFGPDIPLMANLTRRESARTWELVRNPELEKRRIRPLDCYGLKLMSSAFIIGENHPLTLSAAFIDMILRQFLHDVDWGELDYLLVDLPPGTADLQQTVVREFPLAGALVVVTPHDVSHLDAKRVVSMYRRQGTRVLGGIENMSSFACPRCAEPIDVFVPAREDRSIWTMGVERLGAIPMDPAVGRSGNGGAPVMIAAPDSPAAWAFRAVADRVSAAL